MIYHANMCLPKTPEAATNGKYFTQDVIDKIIKDINNTKGYHVVEINNSETCDVLRIEINTDIIDSQMIFN